MVSPARHKALQILMRVQEGAYASILLLNTGLEKPEDRRLTHEIVLGVLRNYRLLDHYLTVVSGRKLDNFDREVVYALRIGAYQILYLSRIPPSAAVNESVKLVKLYRKTSASGLVNAVLRKLVACKQELQVVHPALKYSHPDWLYRSWVEQWGEQWAEALAAANNQTPAVMFRFNPLHPEVEQGRRALQGLYTSSKLLPTAYKLVEDSAKEVLNNLASAGICYIQDEASQFVASLVGAMPGETVLDICAAPGGKTTALAAYMQNRGRLIAAELHPARAKTLAETLSKMRAVAEVVCCDATALALNLDFDRILVDAPCSGTGTLRHHPEIRMRLMPEHLKELAILQGQILSSAASKLKPGGTLVYSTCSVETIENESVIESFLMSHPEFEVCPPNYPKLLTEAGYLRLWPHREQTDGFFAAVLQKRR